MWPLGGTRVSPAGKMLISPLGSVRVWKPGGTSTTWPHGQRHSRHVPSVEKPNIVPRGSTPTVSIPMAARRSSVTSPSI